MARSRAIAIAVAASLALPAAASAQGGTAAPPPGPAEPPSHTGGAGYNRVPLPEKKPVKPRRRPSGSHGRRGRVRRRTRRRLAVTGFHFPVAGPFDFGGADARFGAPRRGHRHQGQDITAAAGTPVVSPHGGIVEAVRYQRRGAGHYVVLDSDGEDRDYVFMHLGAGSIPVTEGQHVRTGQLLGAVGSSGAATGPHLHFEVWVGGWLAGHPIDPLPLLRRWASP